MVELIAFTSVEFQMWHSMVQWFSKNGAILQVMGYTTFVGYDLILHIGLAQP